MPCPSSHLPGSAERLVNDVYFCLLRWPALGAWCVAHPLLCRTGVPQATRGSSSLCLGLVVGSLGSSCVKPSAVPGRRALLGQSLRATGSRPLQCCCRHVTDADTLTCSTPCPGAGLPHSCHARARQCCDRWALNYPALLHADQRGGLGPLWGLPVSTGLLGMQRGWKCGSPTGGGAERSACPALGWVLQRHTVEPAGSPGPGCPSSTRKALYKPPMAPCSGLELLPLHRTLLRWRLDQRELCLL